MSDDEVPVPLLITLGHPGDNSFNLRFPPEYQAEILGLLDEHGVAHGSILELSAGQDLWIEAVEVLPAGLTALAVVIRTFVHRHDRKRFVLTRDGDVSASGISEKEIEHLLDKLKKQQDERDAEWKKFFDDDSAKEE